MLVFFKLVVLPYLILASLIFAFQRHILYPSYLVKSNKYLDIKPAQKITFKVDEKINLKGWVVNPSKSKAIIYYGGNAEDISKLVYFFDKFDDYAVYLIPYRGYGINLGTPNEQDLYNDSLIIFDKIAQDKSSISIIGRSLGSGIATYIAARRLIYSLVLITPYYSILSLAKEKFFYLPVSIMLKDKFLSFKNIEKITAKTLIILAKNDNIIPVKNSQRLINEFGNDINLEVKSINSGHNFIDFSDNFAKDIINWLGD